MPGHENPVADVQSFHDSNQGAPGDFQQESNVMEMVFKNNHSDHCESYGQAKSKGV